MITFEDHLAIQNLIAEYFISTDNADADAFMTTWVAPEEFGGYNSEAFGDLPTWQAMYDYEKHHVGPGGMANGKRHQVTNVHIKPISATEVHVTHDLIVLEVAEIPTIIATGRYNDSVVVKTDLGWKFKRRTLHVDSGFFKLMDSLGLAGASH
jgi:hypothetical protein